MNAANDNAASQTLKLGRTTYKVRQHNVDGISAPRYFLEGPRGGILCLVYQDHIKAPPGSRACVALRFPRQNKAVAMIALATDGAMAVLYTI